MTDRTPKPKRKHAAEGGRIVTSGLVVAAGIGMVGAMALTIPPEQSATPSPAAVPGQTQQQIIVVLETAPPSPDERAATGPTRTIEIPPPPDPMVPQQSPAPAPPTTQSQGS